MSGVKITLTRPEVREVELDPGEGPRAWGATPEARSLFAGGWRLDSVAIPTEGEEDEELEVIGRCEACAYLILAGDEYSDDGEGVQVCARCEEVEV